MEPPAPAAASAADRYLHLARRAEAFVRDQGGTVPEDALISHVFGGAGSTMLWRPLLRQVLSDDDHLFLRADGRWSLNGGNESAPQTPLADFVVIDVETTGLQPTRQRIIEIAIIHYQSGVEIDRLTSLFNPGRTIPEYITKLTGINNELVAEAPAFAEMASDVVRWLDGRLVVGHNVGFDLAFLNAELQRLNVPKLINERIDTMGLATRLVSGLRKPGLQAVAKALGVPGHSRRAHRAAADATVTAEVVIRLAELAHQQGITTLDQLKGLGGSRTASPREQRSRGRAALDRSLLADIPKKPGVYLMRDAHGGIIYVGKAKNLRDRVGSYYSQPLGYTRKMDGLLESIARIDVEVAGCELEALMLESQLIRRYQPRYNTALRSHEHYPFIRVDIANPWPRMTLAKARRDDGARYFGPFRSASAARKTVELINRIIPLRTCTRSFRDARSYGSPCLELDLGRCLGPCVGKADRDTYMSLARDVVTFLDGKDEALYELLWSGLEDAAAKLDFERAARIRQDLVSVQSITSAQRRLRESIEGSNLLVVLPAANPAARELLVVVNGRTWARFHVERSDDRETVAGRLDMSWDRLRRHRPLMIDHDNVDEANLLNRWLSLHAGHPALVPLPAPAEEVDWRALLTTCFAIDVTDLVFDPRTVTEVETDPTEVAAVEE